MWTDLNRLLLRAILKITLVLPFLGIAPAQAGGHKKVLVPVYAQQAASAPVAYGAPTAMTYTTQATIYSAASPTVFSAPLATAMYSTPVATTAYSAPAQMTYATPAQTQAGVGLAPGMIAGSQISKAAVERDDIIDELRREYKEAGTDGSRRERRKTLRDSAKAKFAEVLNVDAENLGAGDLQDIENIIVAIMDHSPVSSGSTGSNNGYLAPTNTTTSYAPVQQTQVQIVQPVVPVQFLVPVYPKHHHRLFHH